MCDKKTFKRRSQYLSLIATCLFCSLGFNAWAIEPSGQETRQSAEVKESRFYNTPNIAEIERAIAELTAPVAAEKMSWIQQAIVRQKPQERRRLNKALNARMAGFFKIPISASSASESQGSSLTSEGNSPEYIRMRIDGLTLGQNATVEDLRMRDRLVGEIANIQDPNIRYELIQYLEAKENNP